MYLPWVACIIFKISVAYKDTYFSLMCLALPGAALLQASVSKLGVSQNFLLGIQYVPEHAFLISGGGGGVGGG